MTIGQNIRACRKQRGMTQEKLGALCGLRGATIGTYENGVTVPRRRVVEKIAAALDVPVDRLTGQAASASGREPRQREPARDGLLYDGILAALREMYGIVEGRVVMGENGASRKYYVVKGPSDSFVLYENDIAAIARSARASMSPVLEYMRKLRAEDRERA